MVKNIEDYLDFTGTLAAGLTYRTGQIITGFSTGAVQGAYDGLKSVVLLSHFAPTRIRLFLNHISKRKESSDKEGLLDGLNLDEKITFCSIIPAYFLSYWITFSGGLSQIIEYYASQSRIQEDTLGLAAIPIITNLCSAIYEYGRLKK